MSAPRFIEIDGKRHLWRDLVKLRQEQRRAGAPGRAAAAVRVARRLPPGDRTHGRRPLSRTVAVFAQTRKGAAPGRLPSVHSPEPNPKETTMTHPDHPPRRSLSPRPPMCARPAPRPASRNLAASIAAHGLLQNLQVRPAKDGSYRSRRRRPPPRRAQIAGEAEEDRRRLSGAVPVRSTARTRPKSASPKTRCAQAMHPADQFEAFKKLADDGKGQEEIAARFGTTPKIVGSGSSWPWSARS